MQTISVKEVEKLEKEYLSAMKSTYEMEREILSTFSKDELQSEVKTFSSIIKTKKYFYQSKLKRYKEKLGNLNELDSYFVDQFYYFFEGGTLIEEMEKVLDKFQTYLYIHHGNSSLHNRLDIMKIPIERVISKYMSISRGFNRNYKCPFHQDRTPSFKVYESTNTFHCFGCGASGNIINFVSLIENVSKKEAVKIIFNFITT